MKQIPPIKSVMTAFPHSIEIDCSVERARKLMADYDIRHLPVIEKGELVSVVTARELDLVADRDAGVPARVRDVCVKGTYVVDLLEPLDRVLLHMAKEQQGAVLVVKEGKLIGIFTMTDACQRFGELLRSLFPRGSGDEVA